MMGIFVEFFENRRFKNIFFVQLLKIAYLKQFYLQYWSIRSIKLSIICPEYQPVHIVDLSDGALDLWSCLTLGNLGMPWKKMTHIHFSDNWQLPVTHKLLREDHQCLESLPSELNIVDYMSTTPLQWDNADLKLLFYIKTAFLFIT